MKYYGTIGFSESVDKGHSVYVNEIIERSYGGDILQNYKRWEETENKNDDFNVTNRISIVGDPYIYEHFHAIRYAEWLGTKWKVKSVDVKPPRLELSIGGVYNGEDEERE